MVWKDWEIFPTNRVQFYRRYLYWGGPYQQHIWQA